MTDSPESRRAEATPTLLERAGASAASVSEFGHGRPRLRRALRVGLPILVLVFLTLFLATQFSKLPEQDWRFELGWLGLAIAALAFYFVALSEIWRLILRDLGAEIDPVQGRAVWGKSLIARYVPTNALMVVGRAVMAERFGVSKKVCLASIVYELGVQLATAVMVGSYFVITLPSLEDQPARYAILALIPLAFIGLHPRVFGPLANFALGKLGRGSLPRTLPLPRVLLFMGLFLLTWAAVGSALFAFASALRPVDAGDFAHIAAAYPVAFCVAVLTFVVPGGIGTRDAALTLALAGPLTNGAAVAVAIAFRILQTAAELIYVGVVSLLARRALQRHGDGQHPRGQRERGDDQAAIAGQRRERKQPEAVPGHEPGGGHEQAGGGPAGGGQGVGSAAGAQEQPGQ